MHDTAYNRLILLSVCVLILGTSQARAYRLTTNITYESPGSTSNLLDLYTPDGGIGPALPTILFIHGGGWVEGDKSWHHEILTSLADQGFSVVSCDYTLATRLQPSFPQAIHDVKAVVRWIRTTGVSKYHLSSEIVPFGISAGGHLAMMLQTTAGMNFFEPLPQPLGGYRVQAAISMAGPSDLVWYAQNPLIVPGGTESIEVFLGQSFVDNPQLWALSSPITHLDPNDPPLTLFNGVFDEVVPFESQSQAIYTAAVNTGIVSWLFPYNAGHSFSIDLGGANGIALRARQIIPNMLTGDSTNNTPITSSTFIWGHIVSGDVQNLIDSDDQYIKGRAGPSILRSRFQRLTLTTKLEFGTITAQAIDIRIESKISMKHGYLRVYLKDYTQDQAIEVGKFPVGSIETTRILNNIDITGLHSGFDDIELTLEFSSGSPMDGHRFEAWIDQIHVRAY